MSARNVQYELIRAGAYAGARPVNDYDAQIIPYDLDYRVRHIEQFKKLPMVAGSPVLFNLNGTYSNAEVERALLANTDYEVQGVNMTDALVSRGTDGSVILTTAGGSVDSAILAPLSEATVKADGGSGATYSSLIDTVAWATTLRPIFRCNIKTPASASMVTAVIWAGWKLTSTNVVATDDNQAYFRVASTASLGNWHVISSNAGTDEDTDTGIAVAASTQYVLEIRIDANRFPYFYINGLFVKRGAQLANSITTLKPFVGQISATDAVAKIFNTRYIDLSQDLASGGGGAGSIQAGQTPSIA